MSSAQRVFVHHQGLCESADVGDGTRVWAFAHVMQGARIGRECNVCDHAFVETGAVVGDRVTLKNGVTVFNGVIIEDDVFVGPNATFTNDLTPRAEIKKAREEFAATVIRRGATIGANATIVCGVEIDEYAFVAAGTVVVRDVAPHVMVAGNPGRPIGWACACGRRLPDDLACNCGRVYQRLHRGLSEAPPMAVHRRHVDRPATQTERHAAAASLKRPVT